MADYIDRQAAIAAIDKYAEYLYGLPRESIASEVKDIISLLPGPWANVEDRPPEAETDVLIAAMDIGLLARRSTRTGKC